MSGLRVLVLNERDLRHPKAGGAEIHVTEIFRRLASQGAEITLASCSYPGSTRRGELDGMEVVHLGGVPFYYLRAIGYCARETRRGRFDVVVECLNKLPFYAPVHSAVPVLALCHHLFGETAFLQVPWPVAAGVWTAEKLIPPLYAKTPFVSISESTRADLVERGIDESAVQVIHCGIEPVSPRPLPPPSRRPPTIVYLGRLEPYKNVDVMLRAAARLLPVYPELSVVVIGRGADQARLESVAAELGIADRTHFAGFADNAERERLLGEARVCVCPSSKEGWGLTVIEANALGTPVVATDAPGLRDSVIDGETGYLAPEGDVEAFARRIGDLLADDALVDRLSHAALEWARRFDWDLAASEFGAALERARVSR
jgi:glycosyltransferase involved in cell wall biosynthesis